MRKREIIADYSCDFETNDDPRKGKEGIFLVTYVQKKSYGVPCIDESFKVENVSYKFNFFDFLKDIINKNVRYKTRSSKGLRGQIDLVFVNSAKFDSHFIVPELLSQGYINVSHKFIKPYEFNFLDGKNGMMVLQFNYRGMIFNVVDYKLKVSLSVRQMGTAVNLPKGVLEGLKFDWLKPNGEIDWVKFNWYKASEKEKEAIIYYAQKDPLIQALYELKHEKLVGRKEGITKSGIAYRNAIKEVNKKHKDIDWEIPNDNTTWTEHLGGGFNYTNPNYYLNPIYKPKAYDVNAMYSELMTRPLVYTTGQTDKPTTPHATLLKIRFNYFKMRDWYMKNVGQGIIKAKRDKYKNFKYSWFNNTFPIEGKDLIYEIWSDELEYVGKMYENDYEILDIKYFPIKPYLKEVIEKMYKKRLYYKFEKAKYPKYSPKWIEYDILEMDIKQEMNSIYGKNGENPDYWQYWYSTTKYEIGDTIENGMFYVASIGHIKYQGHYKYRIKHVEKPEKRKNIYIASYITMLGRTTLYPHIFTGYVLNADTDGFKSIPSYVLTENVHATRLGAWKDESSDLKDWYIVLGYKFYASNDEPIFNYDENNYPLFKLKAKGIHKLNVEHNTNWKTAEWHKINGSVTKTVKTSYGVRIREETIILHKLHEIAKNSDYRLHGGA